MKIEKDVIVSIKEKEEQLILLNSVLKSEYVGIDKVIDEVISAITPYYIFPDSLKKPIIVNLWGMTGTGKTSLVERIVEFLNLKKQYVKYDMGEYAGNSNGLRYQISQQLKELDKFNPVFVFDEFQLGRTIDSDHKEQNSSSSRVLWELLDNGIIYVNDNESSSDFIELMQGVKKCADANVILDADGYVEEANVRDFYKYRDINRHYPRNYRIAVVTENGNTTDLDRNINEPIWNMTEDGRTYSFTDPLFLREQDFELIYNILPDYFDNNPDFDTNYNKFFKGKSVKQIYSFLFETIFARTSFLTPRDYSKSLIFCLGNLDECYNMSHDLDPNADADMFYENSLNITLPDIKKALSHRFRMEQIARLGNTHIIYPSLNRDAYTRYINMCCNKISDEFEESYSVKLHLNDSLRDMIYREGVFPTQGIRPVISTFNTFIQSYIPQLIYNIIKEDSSVIDTITDISWDYCDFKYVFKYLDKEVFLDVDAKLDKLRLSDKSNEQALVAVHEAGHAIVGALLMNISPTIYTKTLDDSAGKCVYKIFNDNEYIQTYKSIKDKICLYYGGLVAEEIIFGNDNVSLGASADLVSITHLGASIYKDYGFVVKHKRSFNTETDMTGAYLVIDKPEETENDIRKFLNSMYNKTCTILKENCDILIELSKYLANNSKMEQTEFEEFMKKHKPDLVFKNGYNNFRDQLFSK